MPGSVGAGGCDTPGDPTSYFYAPKWTRTTTPLT
jgi:hypothetical protein